MADSVDLAPDEKICPFCAETIKKGAIKCRFCQSDLAEVPSESAPPPPPPAVEPDSEAVAEEPPPPPPAEPGEREEPGPRAARGAFLASARLLIVLAIVNALLLLTAGGAYWMKQREADEPDGAITSVSAREDGLQAAVTVTEKVLSYDWRTLDKDLKEAEALLAPSFRSEYSKTMAGVRDEAVKNQVKLQATVASSSVVSATPRKVVTLLFVNQVTTAKGTTNQRIDQNRVLVTLTRSGEEWRASKMDAF